MADLRSTLDPKDYKYIVDVPEPGFSVERNKALIQETIAETEKYFANQGKAVDKVLENRIDIMSSYALNCLHLGKGQTLKQYLGPQMYNAIIGENIASKVRIGQTADKLSAKSSKSFFL